MSNGLWSVVFSATTDIGAGVVTIIDGKILGGDSSFSYVGSFSNTADGSIAGEIKVARHSNLLPSVIPGVENYSLLIAGHITNDQLSLTGKIKGQEALQLQIKGKKVSGM